MILKYLINVVKKIRKIEIIRNLIDTLKNEMRIKVDLKLNVNIKNFVDISKKFLNVIPFF